MFWIEFLLAVLLLLALLTAAYTAVTNQRRHKERARQANERGWRYAPGGWQPIFKTNYRLTGSTMRGVIWELDRVWRDGRMEFIWQAENAPLPYGALVVLPAQAEEDPDPLAAPFKLRRVRPLPPNWPPDYELFATHNALAERCFDTAVIQILRQYPPWPQPGSLGRIVWRQKSLIIVGCYENDWTVLDRLVALGEALVIGER
ncbi:MAG TPA: hypothetical protein ENJ93_09900 [Chloroflexi bacterium]|nr:hypothetical protein [Chloroflexota bacterium]